MEYFSQAGVSPPLTDEEPEVWKVGEKPPDWGTVGLGPDLQAYFLLPQQAAETPQRRLMVTLILVMDDLLVG